jgi:hypothetical protein
MVTVGYFSVVINHKMFPTEQCEPSQTTLSEEKIIKVNVHEGSLPDLTFLSALDF